VKTLFYQWVKTNTAILVNAGSLVGTTAVTSVLGFAYWWLAAREFPPEVVGIASASVSAMMLLGNCCMLGLGTLLITELPRRPGQAASLISTALIVVGRVGGCVGVTFAVIAPYISTDFQVLRASGVDVVIFASGVSLTASTLVLNQALIGLLRGGQQVWRNTLFAVAKLAALFVAGLWLSHKTGITIYTTLAVGNVLSLTALATFVVFKKGWSGRTYLPHWKLLRKLGPAALQHHLLNLTRSRSSQAVETPFNTKEDPFGRRSLSPVR
jgi:O-antigen/teichoic acid export membrane protein